MKITARQLRQLVDEAIMSKFTPKQGQRLHGPIMRAEIQLGVNGAYVQLDTNDDDSYYNSLSLTMFKNMRKTIEHEQLTNGSCVANVAVSSTDSNFAFVWLDGMRPPEPNMFNDDLGRPVDPAQKNLTPDGWHYVWWK